MASRFIAYFAFVILLASVVAAHDGHHHSTMAPGPMPGMSMPPPKPESDQMAPGPKPESKPESDQMAPGPKPESDQMAPGPMPGMSMPPKPGSAAVMAASPSVVGFIAVVVSFFAVIGNKS